MKMSIKNVGLGILGMPIVIAASAISAVKESKRKMEEAEASLNKAVSNQAIISVEGEGVNVCEPISGVVCDPENDADADAPCELHEGVYGEVMGDMDDVDQIYNDAHIRALRATSNRDEAMDEWLDNKTQRNAEAVIESNTRLERVVRYLINMGSDYGCDFMSHM